jgi:arsenate reductase
VITVCDSANETCPIFPNAQHRWHWSIDDPSAVQDSNGERLEVFRTARDVLRERIQTELLPELYPSTDGSYS